MQDTKNEVSELWIQRRNSWMITWKIFCLRCIVKAENLDSFSALSGYQGPLLVYYSLKLYYVFQTVVQMYKWCASWVSISPNIDSSPISCKRKTKNKRKLCNTNMNTFKKMETCNCTYFTTPFLVYLYQTVSKLVHIQYLLVWEDSDQVHTLRQTSTTK